jgi:hypothetical protein
MPPDSLAPDQWVHLASVHNVSALWAEAVYTGVPAFLRQGTFYYAILEINFHN